MIFRQMRVWTLFLCLSLSLIELRAETEWHQAPWLMELLERLDYQNAEMGKIHAAWQSNDYKHAASLLNDYYHACPTKLGLIPRPLARYQYDSLEPDKALTGEFKIQDLWGLQQSKADGGYDWDYQGPQDDQEWSWFFNRHRILRIWYASYLATQKPKYRSAIEKFLKDWIRNNPVPEHLSFSSSWRALEAARRIDGPWLEVFFTAHGKMVLSQELRLMMLNSVWEHGNYLRHHHAFSGNHLISEMTSLLSLSLAWPELKGTKEWRQYALSIIRKELFEQTYVDGAYKELANHYQLVALKSYSRVINLLKVSGQMELLDAIEARVESMWEYWAYCTRPNGKGPLNNDSDLEGNRSELRHALQLFDRQDWQWIYSGGQHGVMPQAVPARFFDWAGHAVMRSGWGSDAQWAFFDLGSNGSDHAHDDRFHLSVSLGQQDILVDAGRYIYQPGPWRDYFKGPRSHNILMIDKQCALSPPDSVETPMPITARQESKRAFFEAEQLFSGSLLKGTGTTKHRRAVAYAQGQYWIVRDTIETFGTHQAEVLWHFHPDCKVKRDGLNVYTTFNDQTNLAIIPILPESWNVSLIRGQQKPQPQGWYSHEYNKKAPATAAAYQGYITKPTVLYWLIMPLEGKGDAIAEGDGLSLLQKYIIDGGFKDFENLTETFEY